MPRQLEVERRRGGFRLRGHAEGGGLGRGADDDGGPGCVRRLEGRRLVARRLAVVALAAAIASACARDADQGAPTAAPLPDALAPLRAFETGRRARATFLDAPPSNHAFGSDPYDLALVPGTPPRVAGILRGADALVLLDLDLHESARVATPEAPSAVAVYAGPPRGDLRAGDVLVASEHAPLVARYRRRGDGLERLADLPLDGVRAARDVATGPEGVIYVVEEHDDRVVTLRPRAGGVERRERRVAAGPFRVVRTRAALLVASPIDHAIVAMPIDADGFPGEPTARLAIDGPVWGFDAIDVDGGTLVVAGGVEDRPLDRRGGFFGWIDSFVYVWFRARGEAAFSRVAAIDASDRGVVVPKAVAFDGRDAAVVAAYGSSRSLRLTWPDGPAAAPKVDVADGVPGVNALVAAPGVVLGASPLFDGWIRVDPSGTRVVPAGPPDARGDRERLGEALFFTELMAPSGSSEGARSRFTCETCHFEGYVDGRTHATGRGDVRATTKPLLGLFDNAPHFTRALDPDLSAVAENEFRVAGAGSGADPHFSVDVARTPWLASLGLARRTFDATEVRLSLMAFLMAFSHRTNPSVAAHAASAFTDEERAGAAIFRDRCERCHAARAAADDASSRVPFDRWEKLVLSSGGPIVWARDGYEKTGVTPYVHDRGARPTSLRRLYKKRPYFTNGSARDLDEVLARARWSSGGFTHDGTADGEALDTASRRALRAFLDLL